MNIEKKAAYLHYLKNFVTKERQEKIKQILASRTRYVTVALEDVSHSQNIAAIMRTCEAMGLQDLYAIELESTIDIKTKVARGSVQWMDLFRYKARQHANPTLACMAELRAKGYTVVATSPHATKSISEIGLDKKLAFVFGTEITGLSDEALAAADERVTIAQYGFVESLNVSVSAALCVYEVMKKLRSSCLPWRLTPEEIFDLEVQWMEKSVERPELMRACFLNQQ